jgi:hypothetical protein
MPLSVEGVPLEMALLPGLWRDFAPGWRRVLIPWADHGQPRRGRRGRHEGHQHRVAHEGLPAPGLAEAGAPPLLALVPLARPRRAVGPGALHPRLIRAPLACPVPPPQARPLPPPASRRAQHGPGRGGSALPPRRPPAAQTRPGASRRVVLRPHLAPARLPRPLVDARGRAPPAGRKAAIVDTPGPRGPGRGPRPPRGLAGAHACFRLGLPGDARLPGLPGDLALGRQGGTRGLPGGGPRARQRLAVRLETGA